MTESEWLECSNPQTLLDYLKGKVSDRKLRLFACACVRQVWHLLKDSLSRDAVEVAERFADGLATVEELSAAKDAAWVTNMDEAQAAARAATWVTAWNTARSAAWEAAWAAAKEAARVAARDTAWVTTVVQQVTLLRNIFGNPFWQAQPVVCHCGACVKPGQHHNGPCARRRILTPAARQLAQVAYDHRQPDGSLDPVSLAAVADALEEAGCDQQELLANLRSPGPHYRGMWSLDLVLGKG